MKDSGIIRLINLYNSQNKILNPIDQENILQVVEQIASIFAAGSFYYFVMNFESLSFDYVSNGTTQILGVKPKDYTIEKLLEIMHPEDSRRMYEKETVSLNFKLTMIPREDITKYKTVYLLRIKDCKGNYRTILHQAKALVVSNDGKIQRAISVHTDVSYLNIPFDHNISFIGDAKQSIHYKLINDRYVIEENQRGKFTNREKEIIYLLSQGKSANEIAQMLFISLLTVNTHKRNLLEKSGAKNTTDLIAKCFREGLI
tara:strand:- start:1186 stop:1959 length:774 start_codon:yes stop_codon:yes gene_type:complete